MSASPRVGQIQCLQLTISVAVTQRRLVQPTILCQNIQAGLDEKSSVEHDQSETEWEYIITRSNLQKCADSFLYGCAAVSLVQTDRSASCRLLTKASSCSRSAGLEGAAGADVRDGLRG